jgi:hypothetical protein
MQAIRSASACRIRALLAAGFAQGFGRFRDGFGRKACDIRGFHGPIYISPDLFQIPKSDFGNTFANFAAPPRWTIREILIFEASPAPSKSLGRLK